MKILDRYILRETLTPFLLALGFVPPPGQSMPEAKKFS
jgi:hypothetical protein